MSLDYAKNRLDAGQKRFHRDTVAALVAEIERLRASIDACPWEHQEKP